MKHTLKSTWIVCAIGVGAALSIGANLNSGERPANVAADNWIAVSEKAGLVVGKFSSDNRVVDLQLYVKTKEGWRQGRVTNDAVFDRVKP